MGIYRGSLSAIIYYRLSLSLKMVLITDIAFVTYFVIADKLSRQTILYAYSVQTSELVSWRYGKNTRCPLSLVAIFKKSLFVLFNATAESVNYSVFWKNVQKHFCNLIYKKKTSWNTLKIYRNFYRKNLSAIMYRLTISLQEIEIFRLLVSPRAFLKLSIIVIAVVQKGLSCPSLGIVASKGGYEVSLKDENEIARAKFLIFLNFNFLN